MDLNNQLLKCKGLLHFRQDVSDVKDDMLNYFYAKTQGADHNELLKMAIGITKGIAYPPETMLFIDDGIDEFKQGVIALNPQKTNLEFLVKRDFIEPPLDADTIGDLSKWNDDYKQIIVNDFLVKANKGYDEQKLANQPTFLYKFDYDHVLGICLKAFFYELDCNVIERELCKNNDLKLDLKNALKKGITFELTANVSSEFSCKTELLIKS